MMSVTFLSVSHFIDSHLPVMPISMLKTKTCSSFMQLQIFQRKSTDIFQSRGHWSKVSLRFGFEAVRVSTRSSNRSCLDVAMSPCRHVAMAGVLVVHAVFIRETAGSLQFELGCHVAMWPCGHVAMWPSRWIRHEVPDLWKPVEIVLSGLVQIGL